MEETNATFQTLPVAWLRRTTHSPLYLAAMEQGFRQAVIR